MSEGRDFHGHMLWDHRQHERRRMWFRTDEGECRDEVRRRALTVLRQVAQGESPGSDGIEGPMWALRDTSHNRAELVGACQWFRAAYAYSEDEELRLALMQEAYGKIERALRCYL